MWSNDYETEFPNALVLFWQVRAPAAKRRAITCHMCGERFDSVREVFQHRSLSHGDTIYKCPLCEHLSTRREAITGQHRLTRHPRAEMSDSQVETMVWEEDNVSLGSSPGVSVEEPLVGELGPTEVKSETQYVEFKTTSLVEVPVALFQRTTTTVTKYVGGSVVEKTVVEVFRREDQTSHQSSEMSKEGEASEKRGFVAEW